MKLLIFIVKHVFLACFLFFLSQKSIKDRGEGYFWGALSKNNGYLAL